MLDPDSDAARSVIQHATELQAKLADAEARAVLNRSEIIRLRTEIEWAADMAYEAFSGETDEVQALSDINNRLRGALKQHA